MSFLKSILFTPLLFASCGTALALPPATSTASVLANATTTAAEASTITPVPIHCDISYCVNGTSYCHFWAGISTWYATGPSPGELLTTLGACKLGKARMTAA
ncbi:hypothetical protein Trco_005802 [Trichoderma cornu-damae]|uniref:Uncharacterized protein n=1 Tax=Trichoderma cornu-damae TaxID=654480 RepID=A0A9P8TVK0_9HYPO|nr:hypothetical protein Trco_005802 [Trichoderma cornu-damae]